MDKKLKQFYTQVLKMCGMKVTKDDYIKIDGDKKLQVIVNKKPLVMPTTEHLESLVAETTNGVFEETKTLFNPLRDSGLKSETAVLTKLRKALAIRLNMSIGSIAQALLTVASDASLQKGLDTDIIGYLAELGKTIKRKTKSAIVDEKTLKAFDNILHAAVKEDNSGAIFKLYIKRGGTSGNKRFKRVTRVTPRLLNIMLEAKDRVVYGQKLRVNDYAVIIHTLEYLADTLFEINTKDDNGLYPDASYGSDDDLAPGFLSLLNMAKFSIPALNDLVSKLGLTKEYALSYKWISGLADIERLKANALLIPIQSDVAKDDKDQPKSQTKPGTLSLKEALITNRKPARRRSLSARVRIADDVDPPWDDEPTPRRVSRRTSTGVRETSRGISAADLAHQMHRYNDHYDDRYDDRGRRPLGSRLPGINVRTGGALRPRGIRRRRY